ncbi:MAG: transglutaminase-like domain-containing protein, partial [Gammaproteobacteria bacterium]
DYGYGIWTNFQNTLRLVDPTVDGKSWIINKNRAGGRRYTISFKMEANRSVIPVPHGINAIANIKAAVIDASAFNTIMMEFHPGWARYDALYTEDAVRDVEPLKEDLAMPRPYEDDLARLVRELDLADRPAEQILTTIENFFADNFSYSLTRTGRYPRGKYLSKFLFDTRQGHCEYFATATVLLLRAAGIPARYAVGYAIDEYNLLEGQYVGRGNHAHSWALAYINGSWRVVDTTPPVWSAMDGADKPALGPIIDLWSWLTYRIATWDARDTEGGSPVLPWLAVILLLYVVWRVWIKKRMHQSDRPSPQAISDRRDAHGALHELASILEQKYFPRERSEPLGAWIARIEDLSGPQGLRPILALHYRRRFDPSGLGGD